MNTPFTKRVRRTVEKELSSNDSHQAVTVRTSVVQTRNGQKEALHISGLKKPCTSRFSHMLADIPMQRHPCLGGPGKQVEMRNMLLPLPMDPRSASATAHLIGSLVTPLSSPSQPTVDVETLNSNITIGKKAEENCCS